ncbi:4-hydroxybenzoate polyprenyltransferase [Halogeometricum pallidum JCM 14848]|uniref:4-hydroxybenzoate polyprenyltransferase n=1 Tax=Halogeometricum pallidum JCM 14848 TaxID=1227487 RepID=M0D4R9_HALPD|nr:UbiA family prenyltransferase [Halogeometricum pallidum]ELZ29848.1 4-hydroxybenzoate polyprenyltransferase [Halogeometricum pallidum JCM 14848]
MSNESYPASASADGIGRLQHAVSERYGRLKDLLVYSSLYLVVVAVAEVLTAMVALSLPLSLAPVVVGLVTFAVYVGDRVADADTDELSNPDQSAFVRRHGRTLSTLSAAAYGLALALSLTAGPLALAITLLPGAFWVLYASDWLPSVGARLTRLKDVLLVNSGVVAGAWAVALLGLPLAFAGAAPTATAAVVFTYFFVDTFVNTEIPNVGDRHADAAIGVSTLPVVFGVARTRRILYAVEASLGVFVAWAFFEGLLSAALAGGVLAGLAYTLAVTAFVGRTEAYSRLAIAGELKALVVLAVVLAFGV